MKTMEKGNIDCFQFDDNEISNALKNASNNITVKKFK